MQKQLFRQYDIRGKIGTEIKIDDFYALTQAILAYFVQFGCTAIVVGMDGRVHCPAIYEQVAAACKAAGVDLYFVGVCSTPVTLFAQYHLPVQACLMITASHNPAEYNGLKIYYQKIAVEGQKLQQIYELFVKKVVVQADHAGQIFDASYLIDEYVQSLCTEFVHLQSFDIPVFIDCGNGTGGPIVRRLIEKMGWQQCKILFEQVDGTYPNHVADPTDLENVQELLACVQAQEGAFGIGLDGDCDRMAVVSKNRGLLAADQLLTLFAQSMQASKVVADIKSSSVLQAANAEIILAKTGCAYIKQAMLEHGALLGGELSGHFFFKDRHLGYDDGIYAMLRFFEILYQNQVYLGDVSVEAQRAKSQAPDGRRPISCDKLVAALPQTFAGKELRIPCPDNQKFEIVTSIIAQLLQQQEFKVTLIDGIRFETVDGWGLIRASNTQPALSVCSQGVDLQSLQKIQGILRNLLEPYLDLKILEQYFV